MCRIGGNLEEVGFFCNEEIFFMCCYGVHSFIVRLNVWEKVQAIENSEAEKEIIADKLIKTEEDIPEFEKVEKHLKRI